MNNTIKIGLYGARSGGDGLGRLAGEIDQYFKTQESVSVTLLDSATSIPQLDCIVYACRTDRQLETAARIGQQQRIPLYVLSSDMDDAIDKASKTCRVIVLENSSVEVNNFINEVVEFHRDHLDWNIAITEYHQASKKDISNTAIKIVHLLEKPHSSITSIRDDTKVQQSFQIPSEHLSGYAIHRVTFNHPENHVNRAFEIAIYGRKSYAEGLLTHIMNSRDDWMDRTTT